MPRVSKANAIKPDGTLKKGYTQKVDKNGRTFYNSPTLKVQLETCQNERKSYSRAYTKCKQRERAGKKSTKGTASKAMTPARAQTARAVSVAVAPAKAQRATSSVVKGTSYKAMAPARAQTSRAVSVAVAKPLKSGSKVVRQKVVYVEQKPVQVKSTKSRKQARKEKKQAVVAKKEKAVSDFKAVKPNLEYGVTFAEKAAKAQRMENQRRMEADNKRQAQEQIMKLQELQRARDRAYKEQKQMVQDDIKLLKGWGAQTLKPVVKVKRGGVEHKVRTVVHSEAPPLQSSVQMLISGTGGR